MILMHNIRTGTMLSAMFAMAVICNQIPGDTWYWHTLQLFMVGGVYIARNYLQQLIGDHLVLIPMAVLVLSIWAAADHPYASASGFMIGLLFGWAVYSNWRETQFDRRMLASGLVACAVDSGIYLSAAGNMGAFVTDTAVKVVPLLLLYMTSRAREWWTIKESTR